MEKIRQPANAKRRADEIGDLVSAACEELVKLCNEWYALNDPTALKEARRILQAKEVSLMVSVHQDANGMAHVALNLLRTEYAMPRPYFEVCVPMLQSTLN